MKVLLISVDGMRPDALPHIPTALRIMEKGAVSMNASSVVPSVTLPCHVTMFCSVDPSRHGTTTNTYMPQVRPVMDLRQVLKNIPQDYTVIITADHGGHDRTHGTDLPEDMTIPMIAIGTPFAPGGTLPDPNLKDLAPTVCALLGVEPDEDWEGRTFAG